MELLEGIFTRKSIRRYTGESLSEDQLKLILRAGFAAPSAHN
ncbi:MAG: nitroreductase family protein, partial [Ruminiclostridium sp.]|nr:nitroreductase family protein [Ruminiclostridium sp.]